MKIKLEKIDTTISDDEIERKNLEKMEKEKMDKRNPFEDDDYDDSWKLLLGIPILDKNNKADKKVDTVEKIKNIDGILFPIPTYKQILEDKKFPYNTLALLMINSNLDITSKSEYRNYLYKNKLEEIMDFLNELEQKAGSKLTNRRTVERHIKTMLDCGIDLMKVSNTENGIVYHIKSSVEGKYYVKLPYKQIRELLTATNKNMLKLFAFLKVMCNENSFTTIDRKFLAEHIGLSSKSDVNLKAVGTMVNSLANLGFIEIMQTTKIESDAKGKQVVKTTNSYRICTYEEYLKAKDRGIIKK